VRKNAALANFYLNNFFKDSIAGRFAWSNHKIAIEYYMTVQICIVLQIRVIDYLGRFLTMLWPELMIRTVTIITERSILLSENHWL